MEIIIDSMTPFERHKPECIKSSRKRRIAHGSGTTAQDINRLLKQFMQMQKLHVPTEIVPIIKCKEASYFDVLVKSGYIFKMQFTTSLIA